MIRLLALGLVLLLSGCSVPATEKDAGVPSPASVPLSELRPAADLRAITGPSTAVLPDATITPLTTQPDPRLPVTVTSHDPHADRTVTVKSLDRIVAFDTAGSVAATLVGLGLAGRIVGRDVATTLPELQDLPVVTSPNGQSIDAESVLALDPTLVITDGTVGPIDVVQQLRDSGIPVVFVQNESSFDGAQELSRQVGAAVGLPTLGEELAARIAQEVTATVADIAALAPRDPSAKVRMAFLYIRGGSGIYYLFGEGTGAASLIGALGGVDVAAEIGWSGMKPMTDEALIAANPDLILVMTKGLESTGGVDGLLTAKPAVALTKAGEHRRFVDMADGEILSFGPRSAEVLDALARAIYAPTR